MFNSSTMYLPQKKLHAVFSQELADLFVALSLCDNFLAMNPAKISQTQMQYSAEILVDWQILQIWFHYILLLLYNTYQL